MSHDQVSKVHGLYQTKANTHQNVVKALNNHRLIISQPCSLGAQTIFQIPNDSLLSTIVLNVKMSATIANQSLIPQFLMNAVKSARVRFSGSEEVYLSHQEFFFYQMSQCASYQKQVEYIGGLGKYIPASSSAPSFYMVLNLFSFSGLAKRIAFPAMLLQSPIQLVIEWNSLANVVKGSASSSYNPNFTGNLIVNQMVPYSNEGLVKLDANTKYTHHFKRPFSLAPIATTGTIDQQTINIQGVPAGLVSSILVYCVEQADETAGNYQYAKRLDNVQLLLNSVVLHNYLGDGTLDGYNAYDIANLCNTAGVTQALVNYISGGANAQAVVPYYMLLMGAESFPENMSDKERISNGISLASQTLQLKFNQSTANASNIHVVLFLEYKMDIYGNGAVQISPVMD